jgi:long-chain acyl-CoA synthetase
MNARKLYAVPKFTNFRDLLLYCAQHYKNRPAFQIRKDDGVYRFVTYLELQRQFYSLCGEFLRRGLLGKRIAVIGNNSYGWILSYLSAATVGVAVPIDKELCASDVRAFFDAAECSAICTDDGTFSKLLDDFKERPQHFSFTNVENIDQNYTKTDEQQINSIEIPTDEMRVLLFTSGTTSHSKGVCLSQNNICTNVYSTTRIVKIKSSDKTLSILPMHHTYECTINCLIPLSRGACIAFCESLTKIKQNALEYSPTILVVVPALLKILCKRIRAAVAESCPVKYRAAFKELSFAEALSNVPFFIKKIICAKIKKSLGGRIRLFIVGAADLDTTLVDDFAALGIRTLQGYGLTETSPLLAGNNDFFYNPRSTGCAVPGVTLKIVNPNEYGVGEIAAKGENVMLGYYKDENATKAVIRDGFFYTGDLGYIDEQGALFIKGRIKNVIVTDNGKNIYPEELEARLSQMEVISESFVLAASDRNGDVCVKAKILPNIDFIKEKLGGLPSLEDLNTFVKTAIDEINSNLPIYKHIRIMEILEQGLERTTTQKIKRYGPNLS